MRIGELAEMAGVSTRTVRHYHHVGLLPEPQRGGNGYRSYELRDLVLLLRARQLVELGLSLDEVTDAIGEDTGKELAEILTELDGDLAAKQEQLRTQRERIAAALTAGGPRSPGFAAAIAQLGTEYPGRQREKLLAELVDATAGDTTHIWSAYQDLLGNPELRAAASRFERLSGLAPTDPAVDALAREAGELGPAVAALLPPEVLAQPGAPVAAQRLLSAATAGMSPAQARCLTLMFGYWQAAT